MSLFVQEHHRLFKTDQSEVFFNSDIVCSVDVSVRRVGGAYGAKITRAHWIAAACGLAAQTTGRYIHLSFYVLILRCSAVGQFECTWTLIQT